MRTTIDVEDKLLMEAKMEAIKQGVTLKEFIGGAIADKLHRKASPANPFRLTEGVLGSSSGKTFSITKEMIDELELEDDLRRGGFLKDDQEPS